MYCRRSTHRHERTTSPVIVSGIQRSGSTRVYNILRDVVSLELGKAVPAGHFVDKSEFVKQVQVKGPAVYKEHFLGSEVLRAIRRGRASVVVTLRDPADAARSYCSTFDATPREAVDQIESAVESIERLQRNAYFLDYEVASSDRWVDWEGLAVWLGVQVAREQFEAVLTEWSWPRAVELSSILEGSPYDYDERTLFHPGHVGPTRTVPAPQEEEVRQLVQARDLGGRISRARQSAACF